ncbi:MAG TPA: FAD-dependent oxidoreductase [Chloroflexia bacterium]|nr:FAD-dependent oxidoreductase [Chloroflexia bacterium]
MASSSTLDTPLSDISIEQESLPLSSQAFEANRQPSAVPASITFPNYMQMRRVLPVWFWHILRIFSVIFSISLGITLFIRPDIGLNLFWGVFIPILPLVFFAAPGLWRNLCPMAALNQTPRLFGFTRGLVLPTRLKEYSYVVGIGMFIVLVLSRKVLLNNSGWAVGLLVLGSLLTAFIMGTIFKGKSGWCSSICPLLPVQRLYGQTPYLNLPNSHCQPCVGCTTNCYDFNPQVAYYNDLNDKNPHYSGYRKFFAGVFPGMILAFYTVPVPPAVSVIEMYARFLLYMLVSLGSFYLLDSFIKANSHRITTLYAAAALNIYYWFNFPLSARFVGADFHTRIPDNFVWTARILLYFASVYWVVRTYRKESLLLEQAAVPRGAGSRSLPLINRAGKAGKPAVTFLPDNRQAVTELDTTLLEVAECNELPLEAGCRMGMCGADPVAIVEGMEHLSPIEDDERTTLGRLGLAENTRLACCARVRGGVTVSLKAEQAATFAGSGASRFNFDPVVRKVVVIGNGVAGVTTADHIRRRHPDCEIHLVGREEHHLYNRMGITRLIYGRSAMQGLYLMPETWYDERRITCWLNTQVRIIDAATRTVTLGTGEVLEYDRLILATGSSGAVPTIPGYGLPGSFVVREAADAMKIRAYAQEHNSQRAVIAGGGLLGLEAAYALHKLGLQVTVLERSKSLLRRQLDRESGQMLKIYLEELGLRIMLESEVETLEGAGGRHEKVKKLRLKSGQTLPCDIVVVAAGIKPNVELARSIGLEIKQGVVVDDFMRTSQPDILAAGDVAEHAGQIPGLWATALAQAEIAAINAIGGSEIYQPPVPVTMLKVVGVELTSVGAFEPATPLDEVIVFRNEAEHLYRKLVISNGKISGAILLGYPQDAPPVTAAIKKGLDVTPLLPELRSGNWQRLKG